MEANRYRIKKRIFYELQEYRRWHYHRRGKWKSMHVGSWSDVMKTFKHCKSCDKSWNIKSILTMPRKGK